MTIFLLILILVISYLIGAIPTGVIISRTFFGFDIRSQGSGNMGSTNIMRVLGTKWGMVVQIIDILKGTFPVLVFGEWIGPAIGIGDGVGISGNFFKLVIGISAVIGHIFSCFVGFKGGKGVNTTLGMLIAILPIELGIGLFAFIMVVGISGFVSLGSMIGAITIPLVLLIRYNVFNVNIKDYFTLIYFLFGLALLLILAHKKNIIKLVKGNENRTVKYMFLRKLCKYRNDTI